ncbi:hypothetical protein KP509_07G002400 [Ceratopteris richardii]|uniref:Uncharacterized protein n=1 Tax=Ceratopteris richardii TaxID=49495 RepID=A0A8T2U829_CERRI|nr:hypothetical protein KP509_07G002400 [Ceratopteris richardii]
MIGCLKTHFEIEQRYMHSLFRREQLPLSGILWYLNRAQSLRPVSNPCYSTTSRSALLRFPKAPWHEVNEMHLTHGISALSSTSCTVTGYTHTANISYHQSNGFLSFAYLVMCILHCKHDTKCMIPC